MRLSLRLLLGFFLLVAVAAWFVLNIFLQEVKPGVRRATEGTLIDTAQLLAQLTAKARGANLRVDQAALAFMSGGRLQFFGSPPLVDFLSRKIGRAHV